MNIRTLLVDDHGIMREGLRFILQQVPDLEIVGETDNGRSALEMLTELSPDLVVMDISMGELNGIEATRLIKGEDPTVKVIGLSAFADQRYVLGMLRAGASGYVTKLAAGNELVRAVAAVMRGKQYLSADITDIVVDQVMGKPHSLDDQETSLGSRERQVLQLVAEGKSSKEIAGRLKISPRTVEVHRRNIMEKLNLHSSPELTKYAIREGLTSVNV